MASINANAGGVSISVTKQADGTITYSADNWPGASFGPNNEMVPGHSGGPLTEESLGSYASRLQGRIDDTNRFIKDKLDQINDTKRDPPYDPLYIANLKEQVASSQNDLQTLSQSLQAATSLQSQVSSLTSQINAADANNVPASESQTNEQKNAAEAQGVTPEPGTPATTTTESVTNSDPNEFKGESGNAPPDVPDPDTSASAALPTSAEDGYQIPPDTGGGNQDSQGGGGYESTGASTRASPSTVNSSKSPPAQSKWSGPADLRVYIKVPARFVENVYAPEVKQAGGILFPYTPSISYDSQASYGSVNPLHSNYTQHFFKNSSISNITISGKFTVQNEAEAAVWLTTVEISRLLVKMPFGKDQNAGSAPPVCRLHAYGDWIFNNVPVAVTSFKFDLPDGVDYIARGYDGTGYHTMVPTVSTFSYTLIPMYSRQEIRDFSIDEWLTSPSHIGKGYL